MKHAIPIKTFSLPPDAFHALITGNNKKWKQWFEANGFKVDVKTNLLKFRGNLYRANTKNKSLDIAE